MSFFNHFLYKIDFRFDTVTCYCDVIETPRVLYYIIYIYIYALYTTRLEVALPYSVYATYSMLKLYKISYTNCSDK